MNKIQTISVVLLFSVVAIPCVAQKQPKANPPVTTSTAAPEDRNPNKLFEGYPEAKEQYNFGLGAIMRSHLNTKLNLQKKQLVYVTWLYGGGTGIAMENFLGSDGNFSSYRDVFNWAIQANHGAKFDVSTMNLIKEQLKAVPSRNSHPPLNKLLIFSFQRDGKWHTRTFDKSKLPSSVDRVIQLWNRSLPPSERRLPLSN